MRLLAVIVALSLCLSAPALAEPACRTVHGRMTLTNGAPSVRIDETGTKRTLGVIQQDDRFEELPADLRRLWGARGDATMWTSDLIGEFEVCAVSTIRAGEMQTVRVMAARNLKVRPRQ